jgi:4'-phosphopantetheinyl transferase
VNAATSADVTVWCWSLDANEPEIERLSAMLGADEKGRAERLRLPDVRRRFVVAHAAMRSILGAEIGVSPSDVRFVAGPHGKPAFANPTDVRFNLSHSHDLAVLAVCRGAEIGVDVECVRHIDEAERIAERFFAESEKQAVARAQGDARDRLFMRLWTCKEAYLKATGDGLSRPFDEVVVVIAANGEVQGLCGASGESLGGSVQTFDPAPGHVGALVTSAERATVRAMRWVW